jgi:hypothetical protein
MHYLVCPSTWKLVTGHRDPSHQTIPLPFPNLAVGLSSQGLMFVVNQLTGFFDLTVVLENPQIVSGMSGAILADWILLWLALWFKK